MTTYPNNLFECPTCGGPHFNITNAGTLVCASVSRFTDFKVKSGGCGWKKDLLENGVSVESIKTEKERVGWSVAESLCSTRLYDLLANAEGPTGIMVCNMLQNSAGLLAWHAFVKKLVSSQGMALTIWKWSRLIEEALGDADTASLKGSHADLALSLLLRSWCDSCDLQSIRKCVSPDLF